MDWSKLREALELESSIGEVLDPESKITTKMMTIAKGNPRKTVLLKRTSLM